MVIITTAENTDKLKKEVPNKIKIDDLIRDVIITFGEDKERLANIAKFKADWKPIKNDYKRRVTLHEKYC